MLRPFIPRSETFSRIRENLRRVLIAQPPPGPRPPGNYPIVQRLEGLHIARTPLPGSMADYLAVSHKTNYLLAYLVRDAKLS